VQAWRSHAPLDGLHREFWGQSAARWSVQGMSMQWPVSRHSRSGAQLVGVQGSAQRPSSQTWPAAHCESRRQAPGAPGVIGGSPAGAPPGTGAGPPTGTAPPGTGAAGTGGGAPGTGGGAPGAEGDGAGGGAPGVAGDGAGGALAPGAVGACANSAALDASGAVVVGKDTSDVASNAGGSGDIAAASAEPNELGAIEEADSAAAEGNERSASASGASA
jgi:hypothetical protein